MKRPRRTTFRLGMRGKRGRTKPDDKWMAPLANVNYVIDGTRNQSVGRTSRRLRGRSQQNGSDVNWNLVDSREDVRREDVQGPSIPSANRITKSPQHEIIEAGTNNEQVEDGVPENIYAATDVQELIWDGIEDDVFEVVEEHSDELTTLEGDHGDNPTPLSASDRGRNQPNGPVATTTFSRRERSKWQKVCRWQNLLGFLLLNGKGRLSVEQYKNVQMVINLFVKLWNPTERGLPSASTIQRTLQPFLQDCGFVNSETCTAALSPGHSAVHHGSSQINGTIKDNASFVVVFPSAWSRMEVSFRHTWNILKQSAANAERLARSAAFSCIESVPMVKQKDLILDVATAILPTKLAPSANPSPLLLSERCPNPELTLYLNQIPNFPEEALAALECKLDDRGMAILQCSALRSVLVISNSEESISEESHCIAATLDVRCGLFTALETPITNMWECGDICTVLKGTRNTTCIFVLVQQHIRRNGMSQEMELLCIPFHEEEADSNMCAIRFDMASREIVSGISITSLDHGQEGLVRPPFVPTFGTLKDGCRFFIDRILLYSDGFNQYNFKQGSAGGVYALSLNFPPRLRRSRERVRVLALTPPGVSTMEGFRAIIDDLVTTCTVGRKLQNGDGEDMVLFTDIVGYIADYHETGLALDITGQNGKASCHLCAFLRYRGHPSTASQYACSTVIHSSDTCYARMGARTECIRESDIHDEDLVDIGLSRTEQAKETNSPLRELWLKLKAAAEAAEIPLTSENLPVVNPRFDPYRSVLVSPDHVLFGVSVNALNFVFSALPSGARRQQTGALIATVLRRNGLAKETEIFNANTSSVHAASITTRFCTLLISPEVFREVFDDCKRRGEASFDSTSATMSSLENLENLRDLVAATYWYPNLSVDGMDSARCFNENSGYKHLMMLDKLCEKYISKLNEICKTFSEGRAELDKPNVHRVLELYKHSIPALGHVRHFAELVFEAAHQPLKHAMHRSNFRDSHLQSSWANIADDWKRRLQYIVNTPLSYGDLNTEDDRRRELLNLLCGRSEDVFADARTDNAVMREASSTLRSRPLNTFLNSNPPKLNIDDSVCKWVLSEPIKFSGDNGAEESGSESNGIIELLDSCRNSVSRE